MHVILSLSKGVNPLSQSWERVALFTSSCCCGRGSGGCAGWQRDHSRTRSDPVDIVGDAQKEGLEDLGAERATGRFEREFPLDDGEDALDQCSLAVLFNRKLPAHLEPGSPGLPVLLARLGGNDCPGAKSTRMSVVLLTVELGVCEDNAEASFCERRIHNRPQVRRVVRRPLLRHLRHHHKPLEVVT